MSLHLKKSELNHFRSCYSTLESNTLDALDELEESRVDDVSFFEEIRKRMLSEAKK